MGDTTTVIAATLDQVGPRLKQLRAQRGLTLTSLAASTGISKSTLSRLETGQRRPSLELLLPLAQVNPGAARRPGRGAGGRRPADRLNPGREKGRTVIQPTRQPGAVQAWKIVTPTSKVEPEMRSHDGHEWLYVLSVRMRLVLGSHDLVLGPARWPRSTPRHRTGSATPATSRRRT